MQQESADDTGELVGLKAIARSLGAATDPTSTLAQHMYVCIEQIRLETVKVLFVVLFVCEPLFNVNFRL